MNSIKCFNRITQSAVLKCNQLNGKSSINRNYCDKKDNDLQDKLGVFKKQLSILEHSNWVTSFGVPNFRNRLFSDLFLYTKMPRIDSKFNKEYFLEGCKEATIVFSNLLANRELDQIEELVTPEALGPITEKYGAMSDDQLQKLRLSNEGIDYANLIFLRDFKGGSLLGERYYVEATVTILKKNDDEKLKQLVFFSDLYLTRFVRDYTDGEDSNTDWLISYYDHKWVEKLEINNPLEKD